MPRSLCRSKADGKRPEIPPMVLRKAPPCNDDQTKQSGLLGQLPGSIFEPLPRFYPRLPEHCYCKKAPTAPTAALSTWQCRITRRYMPGSCRMCGAWSWKYPLHFCSRYTAPQPPLCRKTLWAIFTSVPARRRNVTPVGLLPIPITLISTARTRSGRYRSAGKENMRNSC